MSKSVFDAALEERWKKLPWAQVSEITWMGFRNIARRVAENYKPGAKIPPLVAGAMKAAGVRFGSLAWAQYKEALASFFGKRGANKGEETRSMLAQHKEQRSRPLEKPEHSSLAWMKNRRHSPEQLEKIQERMRRMTGEKD